MYRCDVCHDTSLPGEKLHKRVIKTRPKEYYRKMYNEERQLVDVLVDVLIGRGTEIVQEISGHKECM